MIKKILIATLFSVASIFSVFNNISATEEDNDLCFIDGRMDKIADYLFNNDSKLIINKYNDEFRGVEVLEAFFEEDTSIGKNMWTWDSHGLSLFRNSNGDTFEINLQLRKYQDFVSPDSRGYELYLIRDIKSCDGLIEGFYKSFELNMKHNDMWIRIFPKYPNGFVNDDWYNPPEAEKYIIYGNELDKWLEKINEERNLK